MEVYVYDDLQAEDSAMLQALYSRSSDSVTKHIAKVEESGSGKFMEKFYIGYGHKSIGQCGSTTIYFEGVSLLAAKAIQDSQLYNGQECSTRYIDFKDASCYDPVDNLCSQDIIKNWLDFYTDQFDSLKNHLIQVYPKPDEVSISDYNKAIKARCFDVLRGFLPAGLLTNLSMHTTLSHAYDKLLELKHHPLKEVKDLVNTAWSKLEEKYPNSFKNIITTEQDKYLSECSKLLTYNTVKLNYGIEFDFDTAKCNDLYKNLFPKRPRGMFLPKFFNFVGTIHLAFSIDFGSFRDFQRHRSVDTYMPLLSNHFGFNSWYIEQFPENLQGKVKTFLDKQMESIDKLTLNNYVCDENLQYFYPLGMNVNVKCVARLPGLVYILELRSQKTVHPTLRKIIHSLGHEVQNALPDIDMYIDYDKDDFTLKRASQDIVEK